MNHRHYAGVIIDRSGHWPWVHVYGLCGHTDALEDHEGTVSIGGRTITNLSFADDIDGSAGEEEELVNLVDKASTG